MFRTGKTKTIWLGFIALMMFIFFTQVSWFSDDWLWGSYKSLRIFLGSFSDPANPWHDYPNNGRYLGNFFGFIGANFFPVRNLIMTVTFCMLTGMLDRVLVTVAGITDDSPNLILLFAILMIFCPSDYFAGVFAWTSSFMNYVIPSVLLLISLQILFTQKKNDRFRAVFLILPFLTALFMENLTIGNLLFIVLWILYRYLRKEKPCINEWSYLLGAVLGLVLMFCDDGYRQVFETVPNRSIWHARTGSLFEMLRTGIWTFRDKFIFHIFRGYSAVNLLGAAAIFLSCLFTGESPDRKKGLLLRAAGLTELLIGFYFFIRHLEPYWKVFLDYTAIFEAALAILFILLIPVITAGLSFTREQKERTIFIWLFWVCITAPLLVAEPLTARVFFPAYVFSVLIYSVYLRNVLPRFSGIFGSGCGRWIRLTLAGLFLLGWGFRTSIYAVISHYEKERVKYLRYQEAIGAHPILLPRIPYEDYMIVGWPDGDKWQERYKRFYGLDLDRKFELISFEEWKENTGQH